MVDNDDEDDNHDDGHENHDHHDDDDDVYGDVCGDGEGVYDKIYCGLGGGDAC